MATREPDATRRSASPGQLAVGLGLLATQLTIVMVAPPVVGSVSLAMVPACLDESCLAKLNSAVYGLLASMIGGYAILGITGIITVWRLVKARSVTSVAVTGVVLQVFLALFALMLSGLS